MRNFFVDVKGGASDEARHSIYYDGCRRWHTWSRYFSATQTYMLLLTNFIYEIHPQSPHGCLTQQQQRWPNSNWAFGDYTITTPYLAAENFHS